MQLHYTLLKYAPFQSTTSITLGILFHEPSLDFREFRFIQDFSRLSQLYPEIDVKIVEKLLRVIKEEVEAWNSDSKSFDIEDYTRFWLNDFCFGDVNRVEREDLDEAIDRICKTYL